MKNESGKKAPIRNVLYRHQIVALSHLKLFDSFALFMEQGTGKTLPVLARIVELLRFGEIEHGLIVAPKSVCGAWIRDLENFFNPDVCEFFKEKVDIINFESVWRRKKYNRPYDLIVIDEAHRIKNPKAKVTKFMLKLALTSIHRYILTGTPISNGQLENIWSQFAFLKPRGIKRGSQITIQAELFDNLTYYKWLDKYATLNKYYQPYAYKNVDEIQEIIKYNSYRCEKTDVIKIQPKLANQIRDCDLKTKKIYNQLMKESAIEEYGIIASNPLAKLTKIRQLLSGFIVDEDGKIIEVQSEKIKVLNEFLEDYGDRPLVIFAHYRHSIDLIKKLLKKRKIKYLVQDGRTKDKLAWRDFMLSDKYQVIVCQYDSASTGIDLFRASCTVFYEPTLSGNTLKQAEDRTHRNGQLNRVSYIHLITKGTLEEKIYDVVCEYGEFTTTFFKETMQTYQKKGYR